MVLLKPLVSTCNEYVEGASCGNWNSPLLSLTAVICVLVAVLVSVILAPGMIAPDESFTKPVMLPVGEANSQPALRNNRPASRTPLVMLVLIESPRYDLVCVRQNDGDYVSKTLGDSLRASP